MGRIMCQGRKIDFLERHGGSTWEMVELCATEVFFFILKEDTER